MCMNKSLAKNRFLTNFQHLELSLNFRPIVYRYVANILKMCMHKFDAKKIIFDKFAVFELSYVQTAVHLYKFER